MSLIAVILNILLTVFFIFYLRKRMDTKVSIIKNFVNYLEPDFLLPPEQNEVTIRNFRNKWRAKLPEQIKRGLLLLEVINIFDL